MSLPTLTLTRGFLRALPGHEFILIHEFTFIQEFLLKLMQINALESLRFLFSATVYYLYSPSFFSFSFPIPNLLERDGLAYLLVVVWVVLPGGQLKKRLGYELPLTVPASSYSLVHLEDGIGHVHVGVDALSLWFPLVIMHRAWDDRGTGKVYIPGNLTG